MLLTLKRSRVRNDILNDVSVLDRSQHLQGSRIGSGNRSNNKNCNVKTSSNKRPNKRALTNGTATNRPSARTGSSKNTSSDNDTLHRTLTNRRTRTIRNSNTGSTSNHTTSSKLQSDKGSNEGLQRRTNSNGSNHSSRGSPLISSLIKTSSTRVLTGNTNKGATRRTTSRENRTLKRSDTKRLALNKRAISKTRTNNKSIASGLGDGRKRRSNRNGTSLKVGLRHMKRRLKGNRSLDNNSTKRISRTGKSKSSRTGSRTGRRKSRLRHTLTGINRHGSRNRNSGDSTPNLQNTPRQHARATNRVLSNHKVRESTGKRSSHANRSK